MRSIYLTVFICIVQFLFSQNNYHIKSIKYLTNKVLTSHTFGDTSDNPTKYLNPSKGITCNYFDSLNRIQQQIYASTTSGIELLIFEYKSDSLRNTYKYWLQEDFDREHNNEPLVNGWRDTSRYLYIKEITDCGTLDQLPDVKSLKRGIKAKHASIWYNKQNQEILYQNYDTNGDTNYIKKEYDNRKHLIKVIRTLKNENLIQSLEITKFDFDSAGKMMRKIKLSGVDTLEVIDYRYTNGLLLYEYGKNYHNQTSYKTRYLPLSPLLLKSQVTICKNAKGKILFKKTIKYRYDKLGLLSQKLITYKSKILKSRIEEEVYEYW